MADEQVKKENAETKPQQESAPAKPAENTSDTRRDGARASRPQRGGGQRGQQRGQQQRGGKREGGRRGRRRDQRQERDSEFDDALVPGGIFRCTAVVKGGRRLSFGALVVVGDRKGRVGYGYGKAKEVPMAIQKAIKAGRREVKPFPLVGDGTVPHEVHGRYGAAHVVLVPAGPGTGIIAGATVKTVLEMGGISNVLTKSFGSNNRKNLVKATMAALQSLRSREEVESLRGVKIS